MATEQQSWTGFVVMGDYGVKKASDWRVFRLGLLLKEVGTGILCKVDPGCVTRLKTFVGKVAHLCRVYKRVMILPVPGYGTTTAAWKGTP